MFRKTRLKLTAWYLLIIMLVSVIFSVVIFRLLSDEVERFDRVQRVRIERGLQGRLPVPISISSPQLIEETKERIFLMLLLVNSGVLIFSGGLGYFLAGITLRPIKEMIDEQNQFISDASHELRTPLTSLKSAFEVFLRDKETSLGEAKILVGESVDEVNKLQSLSESLLELAQYQKPSNNGKPEKVSLGDIISEAVHKIDPVAQQKQVTIKTKGQSELVYADKYALINLVVILLDNAVKYSSPKKSVLVTTSRTDGYILLSVKDQGAGISPKDLPHIFDRFYRADSARSRDHTGGYGLGLAIAKKIAQSHQGSIQAESQLGKGSTFIVRLPVKSFS